MKLGTPDRDELRPALQRFDVGHRLPMAVVVYPRAHQPDPRQIATEPRGQHVSEMSARVGKATAHCEK